MRKYSEVFQEVFVSFSSSSGCAVDWHVRLHYCVCSRGWDTGNASRRGHSHIACKCKHVSATELFVAFDTVRVSDQVLLGIPRREGEMFNIRFSYWKVLDVTWDFKFRKLIQILIQAQCSSYNLWLDHSTNMVPLPVSVCSLS